jgi:hypothetical protein
MFVGFSVKFAAFAAGYRVLQLSFSREIPRSA